MMDAFACMDTLCSSCTHAVERRTYNATTKFVDAHTRLFVCLLDAAFFPAQRVSVGVDVKEVLEEELEE